MGRHFITTMKKVFSGTIVFIVLCFPGLVMAEMIGAIMPVKNVPYFMAVHKALVAELETLGSGAEVILQRPAPTKMAWKNATRKLVVLGSKVIIAYGSETALAIINENTDVPIVYTAAYDPEGIGVTGDKATGMSATIPLKGLISNLKKISNFSKLGILYSSAEPSSVKQMEEAAKFAATHGATVVKIDTHGAESVDIGGTDAILFTSAAETNQKKNLDAVIGDARAKKIVTASVMCASCQNGVLISLSANPEHQGKGAARMVAEILDGKSTSEIPPNNSPEIETTINLQEAKDLGVSIPFELLGTSIIIK